jgi:hypothetical protein
VRRSTWDESNPIIFRLEISNAFSFWHYCTVFAQFSNFMQKMDLRNVDF